MSGFLEVYGSAQLNVPASIADDAQYNTTIYMAAATISSHYSCKGSTDGNKHNGQIGKAGVDFNASF